MLEDGRFYPHHADTGMAPEAVRMLYTTAALHEANGGGVPSPRDVADLKNDLERYGVSGETVDALVRWYCDER